MKATDARLREIEEAWVRARELPTLFKSDGLARRVVHARWMIPIIKAKRMTIYKLRDVIKARRRIERGELPPLIPKRAAGRSTNKTR